MTPSERDREIARNHLSHHMTHADGCPARGIMVASLAPRYGECNCGVEDDIARLAFALAQARAEEREALEWIADDEHGIPRCPFCKQIKPNGHIKSCRFAAAIRARAKEGE